MAECFWAIDLRTAICPKHGGPILNCPADAAPTLTADAVRRLTRADMEYTPPSVADASQDVAAKGRGGDDAV